MPASGGQLDGKTVDLFANAPGDEQPRFGAWVDGTVSLSPERFLHRAAGRADLPRDHQGGRRMVTPPHLDGYLRSPEIHFGDRFPG